MSVSHGDQSFSKYFFFLTAMSKCTIITLLYDLNLNSLKYSRDIPNLRIFVVLYLTRETIIPALCL